MTSKNPLWTKEQVDNLNEWQQCWYVHPYTCPNRPHGAVGEDGMPDYTRPEAEGILVATTEGWKCPYCDYTQNWAPSMMFQGKPKFPTIGDTNDKG